MILFFIILLIPAKSAFSEVDIDNVKITVNNSSYYELTESDVVVITAKILNDGLTELNSFELYNNLKLIDSKQRQYSHSSYIDLNEKGGSFTRDDCPVFTNSIPAGLSSTIKLCFEIPKISNLGYGLVLYKNLFCTSSPSICQSIIIQLNESSSETQVATANKIPDWVKNIFKWYSEGTISEEEVLNGMKYLVQNKIIEIDIPQTSKSSQVDSQSLISQINSLKKQLSDLQDENSKLKDELAAIKNSQQTTKPSNPSLETSEGFSNTVCSQDYGIVKMSGKFTNGQTPYETIIFTLGVIDSDGNVVATGNGILSNVGAHDTRIFEATAVYSGSFKSCEIEVGLRS